MLGVAPGGGGDVCTPLPKNYSPINHNLSNIVAVYSIQEMVVAVRIIIGWIAGSGAGTGGRVVDRRVGRWT